MGYAAERLKPAAARHVPSHFFNRAGQLRTIVIRGDTLITADQLMDDGDTIELRPVMSGGSLSETSA